MRLHDDPHKTHQGEHGNVVDWKFARQRGAKQLEIVTAKAIVHDFQAIHQFGLIDVDPQRRIIGPVATCQLDQSIRNQNDG